MQLQGLFITGLELRKPLKAREVRAALYHIQCSPAEGCIVTRRERDSLYLGVDSGFKAT